VAGRRQIENKFGVGEKFLSTKNILRDANPFCGRIWVAGGRPENCVAVRRPEE
jgi:hypothetical protein